MLKKKKENQGYQFVKFWNLILHLPEQCSLNTCISYFAYLLCWMPCEKSLDLWPNRLHYGYVPQHSLHVALRHFFVGGQCLWKAAEFSVLTWMQMSFCRAPSGNVHSNITTPTWSHRHLQSLPVGIEETARVSWQILYLPFVIILSQDKCGTKDYGVNG